MTKNFLAILVCLTFVAVGNSQDSEQTLTVETSLEPVAEEQLTSTVQDETNSIMVPPTDELEEDATDRLEVFSDEPLESNTDSLEASIEPMEDDTDEPMDLRSDEETIEELDTPEEPMPENAELLSVTEPAAKTANLVTPGLEPIPLSANSVNLPYDSFAAPQQQTQPLTTLIPGELNRIEPVLSPATPSFLPYQPATAAPAFNYYQAPIAAQFNQFPLATAPTQINRYVTSQQLRTVQPLRTAQPLQQQVRFQPQLQQLQQPVRPLQQLQPLQQQVQLQQQQVQVNRFTPNSYNGVNTQPQICQPRMGPIERMFRRFR